MDSKQFAEVLKSARESVGMSVEDLDMKGVMQYISGIGKQLVLIKDIEIVIKLSTYDELMEFCTSSWPTQYPYCKGRLDAYGVQHWKHADRQHGEVDHFQIAIDKFLETASNSGYVVDVMSDEQVEQYEIKCKEAKKKEANRNVLDILLATFIGFLSIYPCVKWSEAMVNLADWIRENELPGYFGTLACTFLELCAYIIAIPFGCALIVIFLCSLPFTRSIKKSLVISFIGVYKLYKYFIGDRAK